jgi:mannosyltransferase
MNPETGSPDRPAALAGREALVALVIMAVAAALRLYLIGIRPLWIDEAFSLGVAAKPLRDIPALLRVNDVHPIGYYALLAVWVRLFGDGLAAARVPSLLFGLAAALLTWRIGRQWFSPAVGLAGAALVALNPFQITASNEIRMYPMLECLALTSTWILCRAASRPADRRWWVAYGLCAAAMAYASYYAFMLIPAQAAWAWLSQPSRRAAAANLLLAAAVAGLCYAPWAAYVLAAPGSGMLPHLPFVPGYVLGLAADQTFGGYLFGAGNYQELGVGLPPQYGLLLVAPFVALLGAGIVFLGRLNTAPARLVALSWACPLSLVLLATAALRQIAAYPRHLVFLQPFAALLIAGGIVPAWRYAAAAGHGGRALGACLFVAAFGYPAVAQFNLAAQHNRYDLAAGLVESRYQPGDAIVYFPAGTEMAFRYYFRPRGVQIRVLWSRTQWSREGFAPAIRRAADAVSASGSGRVWLVYSLPWPRGSLNDLVQALVAKDYRPGPSWDFHDLWVTLITRGNASIR